MSGLEFGQVVIDCQDAGKLAGFWSVLLGRPVADGANAYFALLPGTPDRTFPTLMFLQVPEPRGGKNRLHVDLIAADHEAAAERAAGLGATRLGDFAEYGAVWTTLADPEGNVFDIGAAHP